MDVKTVHLTVGHQRLVAGGACKRHCWNPISPPSLASPCLLDHCTP